MSSFVEFSFDSTSLGVLVVGSWWLFSVQHVSCLVRVAAACSMMLVMEV